MGRTARESNIRPETDTSTGTTASTAESTATASAAAAPDTVNPETGLTAAQTETAVRLKAAFDRLGEELKRLHEETNRLKWAYMEMPTRTKKQREARDAAEREFDAARIAENNVIGQRMMIFQSAVDQGLLERREWLEWRTGGMMGGHEAREVGYFWKHTGERS